VIERHVEHVPTRELLEVAGLGKGDADVLIGGPPCQPFSKSGFWVRGYTARMSDPRSATMKEFLRVLRDAMPRAFLLENVKGVAYAGKNEALTFLEKEIEKINRQRGTHYGFHVATINAAAFGVPQLRERVFVVGARDGTTFRFPSPTHSTVADRPSSLQPAVTAWDAIGDLDHDLDDRELAVSGTWGDLLPSIPEGENYLWHTDRGGGRPIFGWRRRYWSFLLKLAKGRPSWTIQAQPGTATGPFHWKNRRLTLQEMCRLQTLPDGLRLQCSRRAGQRMLGNAVPSLLAEVLATEIRRQLLGDRRQQRSYKLLPTRRLPVPPAEGVRPVARRYYEYVGVHDEHPGERRGPLHALRVRTMRKVAHSRRR